MVPDPDNSGGNLSELFTEMISSKLEVIYILDRTRNLCWTSYLILVCVASKNIRELLYDSAVKWIVNDSLLNYCYRP